MWFCGVLGVVDADHQRLNVSFKKPGSKIFCKGVVQVLPFRLDPLCSDHFKLLTRIPVNVLYVDVNVSGAWKYLDPRNSTFERKKDAAFNIMVMQVQNVMQIQCPLVSTSVITQFHRHTRSVYRPSCNYRSAVMHTFFAFKLRGLLCLLSVCLFC